VEPAVALAGLAGSWLGDKSFLPKTSPLNIQTLIPNFPYTV
jgi:hypothetical protein